MSFLQAQCFLDSIFIPRVDHVGLATWIILPISLSSVILGIAWGLPIVLRGDGVSVGAMLAIVTGVIFFFLGLLAEQISLIRRDTGS